MSPQVSVAWRKPPLIGSRAARWAITAALSVWSLRRGRLTWWIPLTAGIVVTFVAGALMAAPLLGDPAIWQALVDSGPGLG